MKRVSDERLREMAVEHMPSEGECRCEECAACALAAAELIDARALLRALHEHHTHGTPLTRDELRLAHLRYLERWGGGGW